MKILVDRKKITELLHNAHAYVISKKTTLPAIQGTLLTIISEKEIQISSTNIAIFLEQRLEAEVQVDLIGKRYILDSKFLQNLLPKLDGDTIILEFLKSTLKIVTEKNQYNCGIIDGDEFLSLPLMGKDIAKIKFETPVLKNYINKCLPFISSDYENEEIFTGIHYVMKDKQVTLEAANRTAALKAVDKSKSNAEIDVILQSRFCETYLKIYEGDTSLLLVGKNNVRIEGENFVLQAKLIEGHYPNVDPLFAQERPNKVEVTRADLVPALKRILLVNNTSKISSWTMNEKGITIEAKNNDAAMKGKEQFDFIREGDDVIIGLNPDVAIRGLEAFRSEKVTLEYLDKSIAVKISDEVGAVNVLVMPLSVS